MNLALHEKSDFHRYREKYIPNVPEVLKSEHIKPKLTPLHVNESIKKIFTELCAREPAFVSFESVKDADNKIQAPLRVGVVLSGGQAPGGHNVIIGIYDYIKKKHVNSQLFGFLNGPHGIYSGNYTELRDDTVNYFRNRGGFDMICSGRHKIETEEQFNNSLRHCEALKLDGLVVIGGDDSNTNACLLAEFFKKKGSNVKVIGVPKTIDGDLKNEYVETSFGFDTACKTYAEFIGNLALDTRSSKKYYHFIRLMGRNASHITLECAFLTRPNCALIGEEIAAKKMTLHQIIDDLADLICERAEDQRNFGVILVSEGLIEFVDEVGKLIKEINEVLANENEKPSEYPELFEYVCKQLTPESEALMRFLPPSISEELLFDRDPHGNVVVGKIETEKLLILLLETELEKRQKEGRYKGEFVGMAHYYGYEGRCAFPTNFDCDYTYSLGLTAGALIDLGFTGLMSVVRNLSETPDKWLAGGCPLVSMMGVERRKGKDVPVIKKALVDLEGPLFKLFAEEREKWRRNDYYQYPGPIQFEFPMRPPFLVKPPKKEELYLNIEKDYPLNNKPYARIYPKSNLSELAVQRAKDKPKLPYYFANGNYEVVTSTPLEFNSNEVRNVASREYPLLFSQNTTLNLIEVVDKSKGMGTTHKVSNVVFERPRIGALFCGRQTPGAHNILHGLLEFCQQTKGELIGFLGGTLGLFNNESIVITPYLLEYYVNQGGMHFLGRNEDKVRTPEELKATLKTCQDLNLDGLVMIGATHTQTDAMIVSEYFLSNECKTRVISIPATVDGNIYHHMLEGIVGFDTATKVYSELIGNVMIDVASNVKYWCFLRLMGRDPSHLVLECALQTQPNMVIIGEEVASLGMTLDDIVNEICDLICLRARHGKNFGTVLLPEGLITHLTQFRALIAEMNVFFNKIDKKDRPEICKKFIHDENFVRQHLKSWSAALFNSFPEFMKKGLVIQKRESFEAIHLSHIETEKLLAHLVEKEMKKRKAQNQYSGSFATMSQFFGYQGRCAFPSKFDCNLANTYGYLAGVLIRHGITGYCVTARGLTSEIDKWYCGGIPLLSMTTISKTKSAYGEGHAIVASYEVDLKKGPFLELVKQRDNWKLNDYYRNPGPVQFFGPQANILNMTLRLSHGYYPELIKKIEDLTERIKDKCRFGAPEQILNFAILNLGNLEVGLEMMKNCIK